MQKVRIMLAASLGSLGRVGVFREVGGDPFNPKGSKFPNLGMILRPDVQFVGFKEVFEILG